MAENLSVYKAISTLLAPFSSNKNVVIRANIASIVDSVIVRFVLIVFLLSILLGGCMLHWWVIYLIHQQFGVIRGGNVY